MHPISSETGEQYPDQRHDTDDETQPDHALTRKRDVGGNDAPSIGAAWVLKQVARQIVRTMKKHDAARNRTAAVENRYFLRAGRAEVIQSAPARFVPVTAGFILRPDPQRSSSSQTEMHRSSIR
jgi:hypothetical protein